MFTSPSRRAALLFAVLAATLGTALASVPAPADAAPPPIRPDVPSLPEGPAPGLPYLDVLKMQIVDGSSHVDVTGLKGKVYQLFKVDGGYLLGRRTSGADPDLVFVSASGKRTLITTRWYAPVCDCLMNYAVVDSTGSSVTFNRRTASGPDYSDTLNVALPSLKIVRKRTFSSRPRLFDQRSGSVLLGLDRRLLSWTPKTSATRTISSGLSITAADISAQQQIQRADDGGGVQTVGPFPPRSSPRWTMDPDANVSAWSSDNQLIAGTGELISERTETGIIVNRAVDGSSALVVLEDAWGKVVWENPSTLLISSFHEGTVEQNHQLRYQLIRCTLAGDCERVGPETSTAGGGYVIATRRSN